MKVAIDKNCIDKIDNLKKHVDDLYKMTMTGLECSASYNIFL